MSSQVYVKGHVFQKQAWRPPILCLIFILIIEEDSVCKKLIGSKNRRKLVTTHAHHSYLDIIHRHYKSRLLTAHYKRKQILQDNTMTNTA